MQQVVVTEAPQILFEGPAAPVKRLDDQHGAVSPAVALQRLFISPNGNSLAVVHHQYTRQPGSLCRIGRKRIDGADAKVFEGTEAHLPDDPALQSAWLAPDGFQRGRFFREVAKHLLAQLAVQFLDSSFPNL